MTHLRIEGARVYRGAVTCSCGEPGCMRYAEEARRVAAAASHSSRTIRRDREQMAARKRAAEVRGA